MWRFLVITQRAGRRPLRSSVQQAIAPVGEHDAGGSVPGLHVRRVVLVEGLQVRIDHVDRLPGRRHQHAHGMHGIEAAHEQELEHVVERLESEPVSDTTGSTSPKSGKKRASETTGRAPPPRSGCPARC